VGAPERVGLLVTVVVRRLGLRVRLELGHDGSSLSGLTGDVRQTA
jgi:hypothetical protein